MSGPVTQAQATAELLTRYPLREYDLAVIFNHTEVTPAALQTIDELLAKGWSAEAIVNRFAQEARPTRKRRANPYTT